MSGNNRRLHVAIHEAAHAVGYHRAGIDTGTITIIPNVEEGTRGSVQTGDWWNQEELEGAIVALLAGVAAEAELLILRRPRARRLTALDAAGGGSDMDEAEYLRGRFLPDTTIEAWAGKAQEFVRSEETAIRYVAAVLLAVEVLGMDDFVCVMDDLGSGVPVEEAIETIREYRETSRIDHRSIK